MNNYNRLLQALDKALGFPNKKDSRYTIKGKYINQKTGAIGYWIAYEVRVNPGCDNVPKSTVRTKDLPMIRELLEVPRSTVELRKAAAKRKGQLAGRKGSQNSSGK